MTIEQQPRPAGRPCLVCSSASRAEIETALLDGTPIAAIASTFSISRTSLRRHRDHHLQLPGWDPQGLSPLTVLDRLQEAAGRLGDLADDAEGRGRIADAVKAVQGQARVLALLAQLGVRDGAEPVRDAAALERAVAQQILRNPDLGDQLAELLEPDAPKLSESIVGYSDRCRTYIASISEKQEVAR